MLNNFKVESVDVEFYYKRKSKFFKKMKEQSEYGKISVNQFLKILSIAYHTNESTDDTNEQTLESYLSNNRDWTRITRSELFSELLDVNERTLYDVIRETNNLDMIEVNKELEVFNGCNYFFSIPSGTSLSLSGDSSEIFYDSANDPTTSVEIHELKDSLTPQKLDGCYQKNNLQKTSNSFKLSSKEKVVSKSSNQLNSLDKRKLSAPISFKKRREETTIKILDRKHDFLRSSKNKIDENISPLSALNAALKKQKTKKNSLIKLNDQTNLEKTPDQKCEDAGKNFAKTTQSPGEWLETRLANFIDPAEVKKFKELGKNIQFDSNILDWISLWLISNCPLEKRLNLTAPNSIVAGCPSLDAAIVVPVLIGASIFQIPLLIEICLHYCKNNMNEVLQVSNFSLLNDDLLTRLSNMFSNVDVEALKDKSDKIRSHLYTQLILSLSQPEPEPWRGHFSSLANIFKCIDCEKLILSKIATSVSCQEKNIQISRRGKILHLHDRDPNWNLTKYIGFLKEELKYWRRVYWRIWAECHFLYCSFCCCHYSVYMYNQCHYHPQPPKFLTQKHNSHVGYYPCCNLKVFRYECISLPRKGCSIKNHTPLLKNSRASTDTLRLFELFRPLIFSSKTDLKNNYSSTIPTKPAAKREKKKIKNLGKKAFSHNINRWKGFQRQSGKKIKGLMGNAVGKADQLGIAKQSEEYFDVPKLVETGSSDTNSDGSQKTLVKFSTRFNQDNQRMYEERILKCVNEMLCCRTSFQYALTDLNSSKQIQENLQNKGNRLFKSKSISCAKVSESSIATTSNSSLSSCSSSLNSNLRIQHSRNTPIWNSYMPLAGVYIRIESEWKDTQNIPMDMRTVPHKFSLQSITTNFQPCMQTKSCSRCREQKNLWNLGHSFSRKTMEPLMLPLGSEDDKKIWVFNARNQELDYLSAAYIPIVMKKEYKYYTRYMKLDWDSLLQMERYWNAFLGLFFETETTPDENGCITTEKRIKNSQVLK